MPFRVSLRKPVPVAKTGARAIGLLLLLAVIATKPATGAARFDGWCEGVLVPFTLREAAFGDFNGDGRLDAAASSYRPSFDGSITLFRGLEGGRLSFAAEVESPRADAVAAADMNLDGDLDLVTQGSGKTCVWLGNGAFGLSAARQHTLGASSLTSFGVAVGDLDGDAVPDVVSPDTSDALVFWRGIGDGWLERAGTLPTDHQVVAVRLGDLDHDGDLDIVAQETAGSAVNIRMFLNEDAAFGNGIVLSMGNLLGLTLADLDADGHVDILSGAVWVPGFGDGSFGPWSHYGASDDQYPCVADLDADGTPDLLSAPASGAGLRVRLGLGSGTLGPATSWPAVQTPIGCAVQDLNGDGAVDVMVAGAQFGQIGVLLGDGAGGFPPTRSYAAGPARIVKIADLSGDGIPEVLALGSFVSAQLRVFRGLGGGGLGEPVDYTLTANHMVVDDFNGDGHLDVAGMMGNLVILPGVGDGSLGPAVTYALPGAPSNLSAGDFTGDGIADLAVTVGSTLSVFRGQSVGGLAARQDYPLWGTARHVHIGEVTGDSRQDVVVTERPGVGYTRTEVFPGEAAGLGSPVGDFMGDFELALAQKAGDLDGDGDLDFLVLTGDNSTYAYAHFVLGDGSGHFDTGPTYIRVPLGGKGLELADVNGDGREDVVVAGGLTSWVWVFESLGTSLAPPQAWGTRGAAMGPTRGAAIGDLDGDGQADLVTADEATQTITVLLQNSRGVLDVPRPSRPNVTSLEIHRVWPTVARDVLHFSFTLPQRGSVGIELFDVSGRRLAAGALGSLDAGPHERSIPLGREIGAGVVWLRVRQGAADATAKAVVAR